MRPDQILREAARLVERGEHRWGCGAIAAAMGHYDDWNVGGWRIPKVVFRSFALMCDRRFDRHDSGYFGFEDNDHRIVALCLAAAIERDCHAESASPRK